MSERVVEFPHPATGGDKETYTCTGCECEVRESEATLLLSDDGKNARVVLCAACMTILARIDRALGRLGR